MRILYQLGSTWPHVGSKNLPKSRLRGVLGRLGRVLERLGLILERLGGVLERFGRVLGRLGAKNSVLRPLGRVLNAIMLSGELSGESGSQLRLAAGNQQISKRRKTYCRKTTYRKTTDLCRPPSSERRHAAGRLRARCGYPKRSKAATPPPRQQRSNKVTKKQSPEQIPKYPNSK